MPSPTIVTVDGLPAGVALTGLEETLVWQNGGTVKITLNALAAFIRSAPLGLSITTVMQVLSFPTSAGAVSSGQIYSNSGVLTVKP